MNKTFSKDSFAELPLKGLSERVLTDRADTSFYIGISVRKKKGDYFLRHDITSLGYQLGEYTPNDEVVLNFCFDEYAFLLKKGEQLKIDIAPTDKMPTLAIQIKKGRIVSKPGP